MSNSTKEINFIVPLWNRSEHIKGILQCIQAHVRTLDENNIKVIIADFHSTDIDLKEHIKQYTFPIQIVLLDPPFIIGKGLQVAAEQVTNSDALLYFCDADTIFSKKIFERIRNSIVEGKTFYAPIVSRETKEGNISVPVKDNKGKGNIGVHIHDFQKSKGWRYKRHVRCGGLENAPGPMLRTGHGGHDGHIYNVLMLYAHLKPVRKIESDQWVRFHKRCEGEWFKALVQRRRKRGLDVDY